MTNDMRRIRERFSGKMIGVIGATSPTPPYNSLMGFTLGQKLREVVEGTDNAVFTGGVSGVGVDVYAGVVSHGGDDRFFVLVPSHLGGELGGKGILKNAVKPREYVLPEGYRALALLTPGREVTQVRAGNDMAERRKLLASFADALIVVNGGYGTLEEALMGEGAGTPVVALPHTGGAASLISAVQDGVLQDDELVQMDRYMRHGDVNNIQVARSMTEAIEMVR